MLPLSDQTHSPRLALTVFAGGPRRAFAAVCAAVLVLAVQTAAAQQQFTQVVVEASDAQAAELGRDPGEFVFTRDNLLLGISLTVVFEISGSATNNGTDYDFIRGSIVIPAGQSTATLAVTPRIDNRAEGDETVTVRVLSQTTRNPPTRRACPIRPPSPSLTTRRW